MTTVLFVITGADRWTLNDGEVHPSGYWAEEVAMPYKIFTEAGYEITVATPKMSEQATFLKKEVEYVRECSHFFVTCQCHYSCWK